MRKHKQKTKRDWAAYNAHLVSRGYLTIFVSKDFADNWTIKYDKNTPRKRGGQPKYTDEAFTALLSLKFVFHQPLRSMEGFAKSLMAMMNLNLEVPDYSTLSIKIKTMNIKLPPATKDKAGRVVSIDSTGLKIHGQGEWNRKKHNQSDRRQWVKLHLAVDNENMRIVGVESTADDVHDCEVFDQLVDELPEQTNKILADGAYDTLQVYKKSLTKGIDLIALPRGNAAPEINSTEAHILRRNEHIERYRNKGLYAWANKNGYWGRNRAETMMSRFKTTFSGSLASRKVESQQNEILLKCQILNILASNSGSLQESVI